MGVTTACMCDQVSKKVNPSQMEIFCKFDDIVNIELLHDLLLESGSWT